MLIVLGLVVMVVDVFDWFVDLVCSYYWLIDF